ncbi:MAG: DUF4255 domain-containing protein [Thiotrichales bacterium]
MSTALAIAGVTAVLRDLLNDGLINHNVSGVVGSTVTVSVLPPDRVVAANGTETSQLNLFLHQVTPNTGWRNEGLPSRDVSGRHRLDNPPLALNLHYLVSAYSGGDLHAEILLGYAMQLLHEHPVVPRQAIRTALNPSPDVGATLPTALRALADSGLAEQFEQLRITPEYLNTEDLSKLWTATQAHYRPTAAYQVSVVLIESNAPTRAALPVLTRGPRDAVTGRERGVVVTPDLIPPLPTLEAVLPAGQQPVALLGTEVTLRGHHLNGSGHQVRLVNERFGIDEVLAATGPDAADRIAFTIPLARAADFPAGVYQVSAELTPPGDADPRTTNGLALVLAPEPGGLPLTVARNPAGTASFTLDFRPTLRPGQTVSLLLGPLAIDPAPFSAPTANLDFVVPNAPIGNHLARLRIDGIESPLIDRAAAPPVFLNQRIDIT